MKLKQMYRASQLQQERKKGGNYIGGQDGYSEVPKETDSNVQKISHQNPLNSSLGQGNLGIEDIDMINDDLNMSG